MIVCTNSSPAITALDAERAVLAAAQDRVLEVPAEACLAEIAVIEESIRRARELVVVQASSPPGIRRRATGRSTDGESWW